MFLFDPGQVSLDECSLESDCSTLSLCYLEIRSSFGVCLDSNLVLVWLTLLLSWEIQFFIERYEADPITLKMDIVSMLGYQ